MSLLVIVTKFGRKAPNIDRKKIIKIVEIKLLRLKKLSHKGWPRCVKFFANLVI
jgi:hypothetical protein